MKLYELAQAITILTPYYDDPSTYHVGAEHDVIYLYATDRALTPEDVIRMLDLGWFQEVGAIGDDAASYNPSDGWQHFT